MGSSSILFDCDVRQYHVCQDMTMVWGNGTGLEVMQARRREM